ncbi:hypothetical protein D3C81_2026980 [compost metagenome]
MPFPPVNCLLPKPHDWFFRTFAFAPWGEHSTGKPGAAVGTDLSAFGNDSDCMSLIAEFCSAGKASNTCANDGHTHQTVSHKLWK